MEFCVCGERSLDFFDFLKKIIRFFLVGKYGLLIVIFGHYWFVIGLADGKKKNGVIMTSQTIQNDQR